MHFSCRWADYFESQGIRYAFFSAANAAALQQARREALEAASQQERANGSGKENEGKEPDEGAELCRSEDQKDEGEKVQAPPESEDEIENSDESSSEEDYFSAEEDDEFNQDPRARVLSVLELEDLLLREAPLLSGKFTAFPLRRTRQPTKQSSPMLLGKPLPRLMLVLWDIRMSESPAQSIRFWERRKSAYPRHPERPNIFKLSTCRTPSFFVIVPALFSPSLLPRKRISYAMVFSQLTRCASIQHL